MWADLRYHYSLGSAELLDIYGGYDNDNTSSVFTDDDGTGGSFVGLGDSVSCVNNMTRHDRYLLPRPPPVRGAEVARQRVLSDPALFTHSKSPPLMQDDEDGDSSSSGGMMMYVNQRDLHDQREEELVKVRRNSTHYNNTDVFGMSPDTRGPSSNASGSRRALFQSQNSISGKGKPSWLRCCRPTYTRVADPHLHYFSAYVTYKAMGSGSSLWIH